MVTDGRTGLALADSIGDDRGRINAYAAIATAYTVKNEYDTAFDYSFRVISEASAKGFTDIEARGHMTLASHYTYTGQYEQAFRYSVNGLRLAEELEDLDLQTGFLSNMGRIKEILNDLDDAETYLIRAQELTEALGRPYRSGNIYINLAVLAYKKGDLETSIERNRKALEIFESINERFAMAKALNNLGFAMAIKGDLEAALEFYERSRKIRSELGDIGGVSVALIRLSEVYEKLGQYNKAVRYAKEGLRLAESGENVRSKENALVRLVTLGEAGKDFELAFESQKKLAALQDSMYQIEKEKAIEELAVTYENEKLQQANAIQQQEGEIKDLKIAQRNYLIGLSLVLLLGVVVVYQRQKSASAHQLALSKIRLLKSQFKPHFMFNALNTIQAMVIQRQTEQAYEHLGAFSTLMRRDLNAYDSDTISLADEISWLKNYIYLEQARYDHRVSFSIEKDEHLSFDDINIPPMVIQPFVENVFQHAFDDSIENPQLCLAVTSERKSVVNIAIKDNGVGFGQRLKRSDHTSKGIDMVRERIRLLNAKNTVTIRPGVLEGESGTEVVIQLYDIEK